MAKNAKITALHGDSRVRFSSRWARGKVGGGRTGEESRSGREGNSCARAEGAFGGECTRARASATSQANRLRISSGLLRARARIPPLPTPHYPGSLRRVSPAFSLLLSLSLFREFLCFACRFHGAPGFFGLSMGSEARAPRNSRED